MEISYTIIRSNRETVALQVKEDGRVVVRAPRDLSDEQIRRFVQRHTTWILNRQKKAGEIKKKHAEITDEQRAKGIAEAKIRIPQRVAYYAQKMGITYNRITIREQKTRWGSCSSKGNLNFNWKLVLMPEQVLDYVVVHELAHRREMNHSPQFWKIVEQELPDYRERRKYLKNY